MPLACAARTTCATLSEPPMLPGLIRTAATPASIALRARLALKWMSAITGIGEKRTMRPSASASSFFGTATRTISQPAEASAAIWAVVASTSCVFVSVIDWTTTGAPPPIVTSPTRICARLAITVKCRDMPSEPPPTPYLLARPPADHPHDVWAIGADLEPGSLLAAYRLGLFPMPVEDHLVWWSPEARAVIPVAGGDRLQPVLLAS